MIGYEYVRVDEATRANAMRLERANVCVRMRKEPIGRMKESGYER